MNPASVERKEVIGLHRITKKVLRNLCKKHQLYQTPELNDVLYLHYQGFQYIECLEEYKELKCLWLECNAISEIQGLENQTKLKCLFLQNNLIKSIENLEHCKELDTLNLASNHIRKIENCGVDVLPVLNTLNLSSNCLRDSESLRGLEECKTLSVLDLANNRIDDILVVKVFAKMPQLRVLVLQGNPVVSKIPQYRKTLILECQELTYLDSRPVFPKDRACAEAWKRGGYNEERKEQERWNRRDRKKIRDSVNATIRMRNKHKSVDEQMDLITSSDSETDEKRRKEAKEQREQSTDARLFMETCEDVDEEETLLEIWDEVSGQEGVVKKVENLIEEGKAAAVKETARQDSTETCSLQVQPAEQLEVPAQVCVADILKMVGKPLTDEAEVEDLPELISDTENRVQRKRSLVEEISNAPNKVCKTQSNEDTNENHAETNQCESEKQAENKASTCEKKRLFIEEINVNTLPLTCEEQTTLTAKEEKNQLLEFSEKYMESADKKPLWVDEIFSQSFVATSAQKPQVNSTENTLISNEIEKEIKQGAIKKRRPLLMEATTSNVEDFFKPVEKTQFRGEFDLNFDELDAPEPESADISDFEDVQCTENLYKKVYEKFLVEKVKVDETKKSEFSEISRSYFKLTANVNKTNITESSNDRGLLLEEIVQMGADSVEHNNQVDAIAVDEKDVKTKKLLTSLIEEIDEAIQSCEEVVPNPNEVFESKLPELNEDIVLAEEVTETSLATDLNKISLTSEKTDCVAMQSAKNGVALEELMHDPKSFVESMTTETFEISDLVSTTALTDKAADNFKEARSNIVPTTISENFGSDNLLKTGYDSDSELSNASDDLVSDTSSDDESTFNKYEALKPAYLNKPILEAYKNGASCYNEKSGSSESEDEIAKSQYNDAANAICDAVMSRVGTHEQLIPEKTYLMAATETNETLNDNYEPELEMEKMLERLPCDKAAEHAKRLEPNDDDIEEIVVKTAEEIKYDVECEEVNRQVTKDFESLNANMEHFIEQLQQEQEQIKGEFTTKVDGIINEVQQFEITDCTGSMQNDQYKFQQLKFDSEEKEYKVLTTRKLTEADSQVEIKSCELFLYETVSKIEDASQFKNVGTCCEIQTDLMEEETTVEAEVVMDDIKEINSHLDLTTTTETKLQFNKFQILTPYMESKPESQKIEIIKPLTDIKPECELSKIAFDSTDLLKACGDHAGIGKPLEKLPFLELEEILERPTLKAYEQEAIELKALLHKLELQNEKLTFVKKSCDELLIREENVVPSDSEEEITEDSYYDAEESFVDNTQLVNEFITEIVDDVVDKGVERAHNQKPKNYVITDMESDEEYSYSGPEKPAEPPVKSIQSVLGAFHKLIQDIASKNRAENQSERFDIESKRKPTSEQAKFKSLKTLLETPSLIEHHKDSYEELKPQVDAVKKRNTDELKQMVERVYAQKDKYDDSLEVVDGRLMVVEKETGEVKEVTARKAEVYGSDESAEEYESAHSSNEGEPEEKKRESKNLIWDFSMGAMKPHTYVPKYRPTMRKSAEELILSAFESKEAAEASKSQEEYNEDKDDEKVDEKTLNADTSKTCVFSNIDEAFFQNLDFKKIAEESAKDEHFVEIARSYEDLKSIIKKRGLETARSTLIDEEQGIAEMFEQKVEVETAKENAENIDELQKNEDLLMHKLVQRTREAIERGEELFNTEINPTDKAYVTGVEQLNTLEATKHDCDSDQETLVDEVASNKTLTFEDEEPAEYSKHIKVVKMLKKLQIDDPIAQDLLKERKVVPDFGEFTVPLEPDFEIESLGDEISLETARGNYAERLAAYKRNKMETQINAPSTEVATQCEPSSFEAVKLVENLESSCTQTDIEVKTANSVITEE